MTVRELLQRIDSRELTEWIAYDTVEPIGAVRTDLAAGIISSTVANCHRGKNTQAFTPMDFMPLQKANATAEDDVAHSRAQFQMLSAAGVVKEEVSDGSSR